jgi:DNA polymerase-3 subunit alpha
LLDGFGSPKQIVDRAVELGWGAVSITEHGWLGSAPTFYSAARAAKIKPIIGCEFYITPDMALGMKGKEFQKASFHLTVLALSREGYENLVAWTTFAMQRENFYHKPRISIEAMVEIAPWPMHHNVVLSGCLGSELNQMLLHANGDGMRFGQLYVTSMKSVFPNFYIEVQNHRIKKFMDETFEAYGNLIETESQIRPVLLKLAEKTNTPVVLTNDSHMQHSSQRRAHIAMKTSAWRSRDDEHYEKSNAQVMTAYLKDYVYYGNYMRSMEKIKDDAGLPDSVLHNVDEIVRESDIRLDPLDNFSYSIPFSGYDSPVTAIRRRSKTRLARLVAKHGKAARERFEHELAAMGDFAHYLLLMSDFIIAAKKAGILTNTRGSAANSLLCYCLKIHDVDSLEYGLLFSRFYNPSRKKLPDIDIDIERDRYEEFMQNIVIPHMELLEGDGSVVPIGTTGTLANRSAFRSAANALGIPKEKQDEISKLLPQMIDSGMIDEEADVYEALKEQYPEIYELTSGIFDTVKNVSQHACGWLFGTRERPIQSLVPLYLIASSGQLVTQYNLNALDDMGLVKGDFLRLKTLSVIKRTLILLGKDALDLTQIPLDDPKTFKMLRAGDTEGIFTLQGKQNRMGCIECEVSTVHDVIASVAIYRPALTREGKHNIYNARRRGEEKVDYAHPILEEILGPTYGVPIFQEQVMEICYAVGMSDEEVDEVYQAIKKAKGVGRGAKEAFEALYPKYEKKARKTIGKEFIEAVWNEIRASQGYGFNKGHATSYGILSVRAAYLKAHHPHEFYTALLDVYPEKSKYIASARSAGFKLLPPSINKSGAGFTIDRQSGGIRIGLERIKGLGPSAVREILAGQPYQSYEDFKERTTRRSVNAARLENLARLGAFNELGISGDKDDELEFQLLGFTINRPKVFGRSKPKHVSPRVSDSGWRHLGREKGVELTEGRSSVSKLFWIPTQAKLELKSSPWANVKTWLLTVLDENGLPFQIMVNEDKSYEVRLIKFMAEKLKGKVVCADGMVRQPFLTDGPQGFRFFGITGAYVGEPQMFGDIPNKYFLAVAELAKQKRRAAYA